MLVGWEMKCSLWHRGFVLAGCFGVLEANEPSVLRAGGAAKPENGIVSSETIRPTTPTIDDAIAKGDLEDVKRHLAAEPTSLKQSAKPNGKTPIEQAVLRNKTDIALHLIQAGADVDVSQTAKRTLLHIAIDRNNPVLITALLKAGVNPHVKDMNGWTPMHHAGAKNQLATMTALLDGGANPMTLSDLGGTPLHEAAASGKKEIIALLLKHKTDPEIRSTEGVTAYDIAVKYQNADAIEALKPFE